MPRVSEQRIKCHKTKKTTMFWWTPSNITENLRLVLFYLTLFHSHILKLDLISVVLSHWNPSYHWWLHRRSAVISDLAGSSLYDVFQCSLTICLSYLPIIRVPRCHSASSCGVCFLYLVLIHVEFHFLISELAPQSAVRFLHLNLLKFDL